MAESSLEKELHAEQTYVDMVLTQLRRAMTSAQGLVKESRARFTSDRESWVREEDGTALFERDAFAFLAARRLAALDDEHEGLVFGRLDFADADRQYIGRLGVRTDDYEPLVLDWRAGAAEPFYRATPVQPMGVLRRRVLSSRDDKVTGLEDDVLMPEELPDDLVVVGDGALMKALGRARGTRMHDIVATIQAEQDEVIRAPYQGFTLITGGPGTGKTVVGLHRVAFLLYTNRRRFTNGGVLVIGPSPIFMDYIERVLPCLGEDSVTLQPLGRVAEDVLGLSASTRGGDDAWVVKGGLPMVQLLRRLVQRPPVEVPQLIVTVKGEPLVIVARDLARIRSDALVRQPYNAARTAAQAAIVRHLAAAANGRVPLDDHEIADAIADSWALRNFIDQWWPLLTETQVLARLADPRLARSLGVVSPGEADLLAASIDPDHWTVADIPLLDELADLLGPLPPGEDDDPLFSASGVDELVTISERLTDTRHLEAGAPVTTYAHILVDEAQDITPMQWRMIARRGSGASWTIVGDPAQSSWPDRAEPERALTALIGSRPRRFFRLSTNYRSPQEAYDLATAYIRSREPDADIPVAVRSTGVGPRLLVADSGQLDTVVRDVVAGLLAEVEGTVGVISLPGQAVPLPADPRLVRLDPHTAKGLEFDAVVVVDPDSIAVGPSGPRTLYVALTRPTQILVTIDLDAPGAWRDGLGLVEVGPDGAGCG